MNETLRAWLTLVAIVLAVGVTLWGLPLYARYFALEMKKTDILFEQYRQSQKEKP